MSKKNRPTNKNQPSANEQPKDNENREPEQFSLLPPEPFNPTWPNAGTLAAAVNEQLLTGARINQFSFGTQFWRLAAYVQTLKDLDWPVRSSLIHHPSKTKPIAEYFYTPDTITAAKAMRGAA
ncbi:hypothetical protein LGM14_11080 [Burkholderia multivorans]|nr:hypothetical protein [Burkholderia multivorans]